MRRSDFIFKYRVRNWPEYNKALIARGSLTFWVDEQAVSTWRRRGGPQGRGRPRIYSDTAIECALVVRTVFHLSLRATQGFLESVVRLMEVDLPVPAYSTMGRRQAGLDLRLQATPARQPRHVVIDTTGLKVFGAGEWYVRKHGNGERPAPHQGREPVFMADFERCDPTESCRERRVEVQGSAGREARVARVRAPAGWGLGEAPGAQPNDGARDAEVRTHLSALIRLHDAGHSLLVSTPSYATTHGRGTLRVQRQHRVLQRLVEVPTTNRSPVLVAPALG